MSPEKKTTAKKTTAGKITGKKTEVKKASSKKTAAKKTTKAATDEKKTAAKKPAAKKTTKAATDEKKTAAKKPAVKKTTKAATAEKKTAAKKPAANKTTKAATAEKKTAAKKPAAKKTTKAATAEKKTAAKKPAAKKTTKAATDEKKTAAKKPAAKKTTKAATDEKKTAAKKPAVKKTTKAATDEKKTRAAEAEFDRKIIRDDAEQNEELVVEAAKYHTTFSPFREEAHYEPVPEIPLSYGEDYLVLLTRDPEWFYAYWELTHNVFDRLIAERGNLIGGSRLTLRVYDLGPAPGNDANREDFFDIAITGGARDWFFHLDRRERACRVELGLKTESGEFIGLMSSNRSTSPPERVSEIVDDRWISSEQAWAGIFQASGVIGSGFAGQASQSVDERPSSPDSRRK